MKTKLLILGAVLTLFSATSYAQLTSSETFSGYTAGVELPTDIPSPAVTGYTGNWTDIDFGDAEPFTEAGSLSYGGAGYAAGLGNHIAKGADTAGTGAGNSGRVYRLLDNTLKVDDTTAGTIYLSWLFKTGNENAAANANAYQTLALYNTSTADGNRNFDAGISVGDFGTADYGYRVKNNLSLGGGSLGVATDSGVHLFVAKFVLSATASSDSVTVWVDPALGAGEPAGGVAVSGINLQFDRLAFSDYASDSSAWDEIRWGTSFDGVTITAPPAPPTVVAEANPSSAKVNDTFTVTATVTPGAGTVTNVSIDLSQINGSAAASLVLSNANVYTNTFTVPGSATVGGKTLVVSAKDTTPMTGTYNLAFTVIPSGFVWDGGSGIDSKWSSAANWVGDLAPASSGSALAFAGTTRLTPDMAADYSIAGITFGNNAGSFTISSSTGGILTSGSGGIVNNSANPQTLNVPVVLGAAQTFDAAAGNLTLGQAVTKGGNLVTVTGPANTTISGPALGSGSLFKQGSGSLVISSNSTWDLAQAASGGFSGPLIAQSGTLVFNKGSSNTVAGELVIGGVVADGGDGNNAKIVVDNAILNVSSWFSVGRGNGVGGVSSDLVVTNGGVVTAQNFSAGFNGGNPANMPKGSITLSDTASLTVSGDNLNFGESAGSDMTLNLNGGILTVNKFNTATTAGTGTFNFNGGTLKPTVSRTDFWNNSAVISAQVRNGGAIVDTAGFNITIGQPLAHSTNPDDNANDGGLTKVGNGTLILAGGYYYTGPTKVLSGTLSLNSSLGVPGTGGDLLVSNAVLTLDASSGAVMPAANMTLKNGANLNVTNYPYGNAIYGTGNLTLSGGTTIHLNYGTLSGTPAAAINVAGSFSASGTNVINITGSGFAVGQFPLIDYTGTAVPTNSFRLASLPPGVTAVLVNNADNTSLDLLVSVVGNALSWHGASADNSVLLTTWNINTSANWYDAGYNAVPYVQYGGNAYGDLVTFGDYGYNLDGTNSVNLPGRVVPSSVTADNSYPYVLTGAGGIDGTTAFVKNGANWFLLGTSNNYTGGTFVNAGTLAITNNSALGASSSLLTLGAGTLQVAGNMANPHATILSGTANVSTGAGSATVSTLTNVTSQLQLNPSSGAGLIVNGEGTLILSGTNDFAYFYAGDATVGGNLLITNGSFVISQNKGDSKFDQGGNVTIANGGVLAVRSANDAWFPLGDTAGTTSTMTIAGGTFIVTNQWGLQLARNGDAVLSINSGNLIVNDWGGANNGLSLSEGGGNSTFNLNGGRATLLKLRPASGVETVNLNGGTLSGTVSRGDYFQSSGNMTANVRNGGVVVDTAGFDLGIGQPLLHSTILGDNAIDGGLTKTGNGTLTLTGTNTYTGPTVVNAGALAGNGTIAGALTNNATLAPGNGGPGTLTVAGDITLKAGSTNTFAVDGTTLAKSSVTAGASVTYGGVLNIVPSGTFAAGQQFQLFSGTGATNTGSFAGIAGAPGSGLAFSFTNGVLSVVGTMAGNPTNITFSVSGSLLSLSWPADHLGWILQTQTNSLNSGLSTNWVDVTGSGTITSTNITINPALPTAFYRLRHP